MLVATGALSLLVVLAFSLQWPPALALWPWPLLAFAVQRGGKRGGKRR